jgi:hypothetical protein
MVMTSGESWLLSWNTVRKYERLKNAIEEHSICFSQIYSFLFQIQYFNPTMIYDYLFWLKTRSGNVQVESMCRGEKHTDQSRVDMRLDLAGRLLQQLQRQPHASSARREIILILYYFAFLYTNRTGAKPAASIPVSSPSERQAFRAKNTTSGTKLSLYTGRFS